jgi:prevent-host-death family protein
MEVVMTITTLTSRELNQDLARAKRATKLGPVVVTDRGKPAHVLLSFSEYRRLTASSRTLADALGMPESADIKFDPPKIRIEARAPCFD